MAQGRALDLVWSLWTELGVSGLHRAHSEVGIDLEPLIVITAQLAAADARLRDEALNWCLSNSAYVSSDRLRNYLKTVDEGVARAFGSFASTVKSAKRVSWPAEGEPYREFQPTRRSAPPDLSRPALVQLRLRAAFGVSARAELLRWMMDQPNRFMGSLELATTALYGKDNVADTLDLLARAGLLLDTTLTSAGAMRVFRPDGNSAMIAALRGWVTVPQQRWDAVFRVVVALIEFARTRPANRVAGAVAIQRLLPRLQADLRWLGSFPHLHRGVDAVNDDFDRWAVVALDHWAGGGR